MQEQAWCSDGAPSADNPGGSSGVPGALDAPAGCGAREWSSPEHAEQEARRMFANVLRGWAWDVLRLQGAGMHVPGYHQAVAA